MSLNKFTSADPVKKWMNIGCNSITVGGFPIGNSYAWVVAPDDTPIPQVVGQYPTLTRITPQVGTFQTSDPDTYSSNADGIQVNETGTYSVNISVGYSHGNGPAVEYLGSEDQTVYQSIPSVSGTIYIMSYNVIKFITSGTVISPWMASTEIAQTLQITSTNISINRLS